MGDYREYYTVVYRNDQRMIILNDNAKPTQKPVLKPVPRRYYAEKNLTPDKATYNDRFSNNKLRLGSRAGRVPFKLLPRTRDLEEKKLGMAAKKRLTELTQEKITVCLTERGKYGRWLGTLFSGETNINQQLIAEGHAHEYFGGKRKEFK